MGNLNFIFNRYSENWKNFLRDELAADSNSPNLFEMMEGLIRESQQLLALLQNYSYNNNNN